MNFKQRCAKVAEDTGLDVDFYNDPGPKREFEDDGVLHIVRGKIRAVFNVSNGQNDAGCVQNEKTRRVAEALGIKVTEKMLTDDTDEGEENEDDVCPHCGR